MVLPWAYSPFFMPMLSSKKGVFIMNQMLAIFHQGGPVMYLFLIVSILTISIGIDRFMVYRKTAGANRLVEETIAEQFAKGQAKEALAFAKEQPDNVLAQLIVEGLTAKEEGFAVDTTLEAQAMRTVNVLQDRLSLLSTFVTLSPILGLLGTVIGMIDSFSVLDLSNGQPMAITNGVGEALVATAGGLAVATVALVLHAIFSRRVNLIVSDMEQMMATIIRFTHKKENA